MNEFAEAYFKQISADMLADLYKPSPIWDLFIEEGQPGKIPMKATYGKLKVSKEAAEKMFPPPPEGKLWGIDKQYYKKTWACGCSDAGGLTDGGSYFCFHWLKRPNSCDRRKSDG